MSRVHATNVSANKMAKVAVMKVAAKVFASHAREVQPLSALLKMDSLDLKQCVYKQCV